MTTTKAPAVAQPPLKTVLLSLTETLDRLSWGNITMEEMRGAVFCFGCTRGQLFDHDSITLRDKQLRFQRSTQVTSEMVFEVQEAIKVAELEGRVVWRRSEIYSQQDILDRLNTALELIGLKRMDASTPPYTINSSHLLKEAIEAKNHRWDKPIKVLVSERAV